MAMGSWHAHDDPWAHGHESGGRAETERRRGRNPEARTARGFARLQGLLALRQLQPRSIAQLRPPCTGSCDLIVSPGSGAAEFWWGGGQWLWWGAAGFD